MSFVNTPEAIFNGNDGELYTVIVALAITLFIAFLVLALFFLLKESKVAVSSSQISATIPPSPTVKKRRIKATKETLRAAFLAKERAESFLSKLDELKAQNEINEALYNNLKQEYIQMQQQALPQIDLIKAEFQGQLDILLQEQSTLKFILELWESKLLVRQIPVSQYIDREKELNKKMSRLREKIGELEAWVNATGTAAISYSGNRGMPDPIFESLRTGLVSKIPSIATDLVSNKEAVDSKSVIAEEKYISPGIGTEPVPSLSPVHTPKVTNLEILPNCVRQGNSIGIVATVFNNREEEVTYQADLKINGDTKQSFNLVLAPRAVQEITFTVVADTPGEFQVDFGDLGSSFTVIPSA